MEFWDTLSEDIWWDIAKASNDATFYHTPLWRDLWAGAFPGWRDHSLGGRTNSGVRFALPLSERRRKGGEQYLTSNFDWVLGGVICDGELSDKELLQIYEHICNWNSRVEIVVDDVPDGSESLFYAWSFSDSGVDLRSGFDAYFASLGSRTRTYYRKLVREGMVFRRAETDEDWLAFYVAYKSAVERWRSADIAISGVSFNEDFVRNIFEQSLKNPELIGFYVIEKDGQILGGGINFYWNKRVENYSVVAHTEFLKKHPITLFQIETIKDACARGVEFYDMGANVGRNGVSAYKSKFRAKEREVYQLNYRGKMIRVKDRAKRLMASIR